MEHFGMYKGQDVYLYKVENQNGTRLRVLNFGGIWHEFSVVDGGKRVNLVLASPNLAGYTDNPFYINRVIGRTAGRIAYGKIPLNDQVHTTPTNEGQHSLHGGGAGFSEYFYAVSQDGQTITLTGEFDATTDGFTGKLELKITYTLTDDDEVIVAFTGTQRQADGVFNPTSHVYFNLADTKTPDITGHDLWLNSTQHLAVDADKIPTGKYLDNRHTPYDLQQQSDLGQALQRMQGTDEQGFDDIFVIDERDTAIARLTDRTSRRSVAIYSQRNGLVVFTANSFTPDMTLTHGDGHAWQAVALEAQTLPNSPNIPAFGDITLRQDTARTEVIRYRYVKK
jgi:aldose 1-epimerase